MVLQNLPLLRSYEKQHFPYVRTIEDQNLIREIGYHQQRGSPLTLRQLFLLDLGSVATVQRRLRHLRQAGAVRQRKSATDRRAIELRLSPACMKAFASYARLLLANPRQKAGARGIAAAAPARRHLCALCEGEAAFAKLAVLFLAEGLRNRERCILVGATGPVRDAILSGLHGQADGIFARALEQQLIVLDHQGTADQQIETLRRVFADAKAAGRSVRLVQDVARARAKGIDSENLARYQRRLDALARQYGVTGLSICNVGELSSREVLRTLKSHRDTARYPLLLG